MEIEDILFSKSDAIDVSDPLSASLMLLEKASHIGEVVEKKNVLETDGPGKRLKMEFDVVRRYDDYSQFRINVSMSAEIDEKKTLEIDMEGSVTTKIEEEGFFSSVFAEFYLQGLYERTTALSKKGLEEARKDMESSIAALAKRA